MNKFEKIYRVRAALFIAAFTLGGLATARSLELVWISADQVDQLTSEFGYKPHNNCQVSRNETGTMLFLSSPIRGGGTLVQIVSHSGTRTNFVEGRAPVVNDDCSPICYIAKNAFKFSSGCEILRTFAGRIGFCPSRDYFFRCESVTGAVFRTSTPEIPLFELPKTFWPQSIFLRTNDIYLFGRKTEPGANRSVAWGLVYASKGGFRLENEIDLSAFNGVCDMDPNRGLLLVTRGFEMFEKCGLYDLEAEEYRSLGRIRGDGLFLDESFRRYLEEHWKMKLARPPAPADAEH